MHLHVVKPDPDLLARLPLSSEIRESDEPNSLNHSSNSSETLEVDETVLDTDQRARFVVTMASSCAPPALNKHPPASHQLAGRNSVSSFHTRRNISVQASPITPSPLLSPIKDHTIVKRCSYTQSTESANCVAPNFLHGSLPTIDGIRHRARLPPIKNPTESPCSTKENDTTEIIQPPYAYASTTSKTTTLAFASSPEHGFQSAIPAGCNNSVSSPPYICAICEDKASGRHYGVLSCEGCKGFFKRTVRKQTKYTCRGEGRCPVDKRKRTRCQACRYDRCIAVGMRREAVQEERQHMSRVTSVLSSNATQSIGEIAASVIEENVIENKKCALSSAESVRTTSTAVMGIDDPAKSLPDVATLAPARSSQLTLTNLLVAELSTDSEMSNQDAGDSIYIDIGEDSVDPLILICQSVERQLSRLITWARQLACFSSPFLSMDDQLCLLKSAWSELLLISAAFNSIVVNEGLLLASGRHLSREKARQHGLGSLMDRFLTELVARFRELGLERVELAFLRAIILFNPDANNLTARDRVESVRENLYAGLHSYCTTSHANDASRFTKLLLRLPPLRSIAHKCLEHLVFVKLAAEDPSSRRLINLVEHGVWPSADPCEMSTQAMRETGWHAAESSNDI